MWKPSKNERSFGNRSQLDRKLLQLKPETAKCVLHFSLNVLFKHEGLTNFWPDMQYTLADTRVLLQVTCSLMSSNVYHSFTSPIRDMFRPTIPAITT